MSIAKLNKLDRFDYLYFLIIVVVYAGMALPYAKNMFKPKGEIMAAIIPYTLTATLLIKHKVSFFNRRLLIVTGIYIFWCFLQILKYNKLYDGFFLSITSIYLGYSFIVIYGIRMFYLYERILIAFSIIAIVCWFFQLLVPAMMTSFMKATSLYNYPKASTILANNIFFSLSDYVRDSRGGYFPRNAGFSWEPGRYACMVIMAMFFNLIRTKFTIKKNRGLLILSIALISTQSTTGLGCLMLLFLFYGLNVSVKFRPIIFIIVVIPVVGAIFLLPFMGDKISELWFNEESINQIEHSVKYLHNSEKDIIVPQRFTALALEMLNIWDSPLLGYGVDSYNSYVKSTMSPLISLPGGLLKIVSQYGIPLSLLVYFQLYKTSKYFSKLYNYKGGWVLFALFALLSLSYPFWFVPFFSSIWMLQLFYKKNIKSL